MKGIIITRCGTDLDRNRLEPRIAKSMKAIAAQQIRPDIIVLRGHSARMVTIGALATFRTEWVPISDLAKAIGSQGSAITKHLNAKRIEIFGLTNPKNGARRGGLIRLRDVVTLAGLAPLN